MEALYSLTFRGVDRDEAVRVLRRAWLKGPQLLAVPGGHAAIRWSAWKFAVSPTIPAEASDG